MKILAIAKVGFKECLGYKVVYLVFIMAFLFILLGKSCTPGKITGNDVFFDAKARHDLSVKVAFNGIVFWSMMLCGLIAANMLSRELEEGTAVMTLSRPLSRTSYLAGKLLCILMISAINLFLLGGIFCLLFYIDFGWINPKIFISFLLVVFNILLYSLLVLFISLFVPRFIAPLIGIFIYLTSCWSALPFYYDNLKLIWIPSDTVLNIHRFLPRYGDLQLIATSYIDSPVLFNDLISPLCNILIYLIIFWFLIIFVFRKKEIT